MSFAGQLRERTAAARREYGINTVSPCETFGLAFANHAPWREKILNACEAAADQGEDALWLDFKLNDGRYSSDVCFTPYYAVLVNDNVLIFDKTNASVYNAIRVIYANWNNMRHDAAHELDREFGLHCEPGCARETELKFSFEFSWKDE